MEFFFLKLIDFLVLINERIKQLSDKEEKKHHNHTNRGRNKVKPKLNEEDLDEIDKARANMRKKHHNHTNRGRNEVKPKANEEDIDEIENATANLRRKTPAKIN